MSLHKAVFKCPHCGAGKLREEIDRVIIAQTLTPFYFDGTLSLRVDPNQDPIEEKFDDSKYFCEDCREQLETSWNDEKDSLVIEGVTMTEEEYEDEDEV